MSSTEMKKWFGGGARDEVWETMERKDEVLEHSKAMEELLSSYILATKSWDSYGSEDVGKETRNLLLKLKKHREDPFLKALLGNLSPADAYIIYQIVDN